MAVPKRRTSKTKKNKRRSHYKLPFITVSKNKKTGKWIRPHHIDRKKKVKKNKKK